MESIASKTATGSTSDKGVQWKPVPDPAKTETAEQVLKTSLPDYGAPKTFLQNIGMAIRSAEKLFEAATDTDQDRQNKADLRQAVFSWLAETKTSVYDL